MKTFDVQQGTEEWLKLRMGVVTASEADSLVTPLWKIKTGEAVETLLYKKLCEKTIGWRTEFAGTFEMNQGNVIETIALPWFNFTYDTCARRVGFCLSDDGRYGCSPDGLLGDDNGLEIKSPQPPAHLKYLLRNELPPEYRAQVHFSMLVTGRPKWTFLSYSRQFPSLVIEVQRDEEIQETLREALRQFLARFDEKLAWLKQQKEEQDAPLKAAYEEKIRNWEKTGVVP